MRMRFEQPRDISKILLPFAASPAWILRGPDFSAQNVLDRRDRQRESKNVSILRSILLKLDAKVRTGRRDVETVRKISNLEGLAQ